MPELPEVETVRRGLALRMSGRRIVRAELRRPDLRRPFPPMLAERLDGALIGALARRGKYILIELDETGLLLLHLGMSGRIIAGDANGADAKHDHVVLTLDDGTVVRLNDARRFGILDYLRRGEEATHPLLAGMGPEPLEPGFDGAYLSRALARTMTPIKSALLDQPLDLFLREKAALTLSASCLFAALARLARHIGALRCARASARLCGRLELCRGSLLRIFGFLCQAQRTQARRLGRLRLTRIGIGSDEFRR